MKFVSILMSISKKQWLGKSGQIISWQFWYILHQGTQATKGVAKFCIWNLVDSHELYRSVRSKLDGIRKIDDLWDIEVTLQVSNLEATVGFSYEELSFVPEVICYFPPVFFYFNVC